VQAEPFDMFHKIWTL